MPLSVTMIASISERFSKLIDKNEYEPRLCELMNQSEEIFPGRYERVAEQYSGQCDYVEVESGTKFDARIMNHYDIVASDKIAVEAELLRRWSSLPYVALPVELKKRIDTLRYHKKRNESIRFHIGSVNMCRPYVAKTDDIYNFLTANNITV